MLRIIEVFNNLPVCVRVDSRAYFQPGQVASLKMKKGEIVAGVCDGLHPCGIIDDIRIRSNVLRMVPKPFNQVHIVPINHPSFDEDLKQIVLAQDHSVKLNHVNIIADSFISDVPGQLKSVNGELILPKGTICNHRISPMDGGCYINYAVRLTCRYAYNVPAPKMDDSTVGSGQVTLWTKNMIADTDMYDTAQEYHKYANLYVENSLLTTKRLDYTSKRIGIVLDVPSNDNSMLRFLLDLEGNVDVGQLQ
jgi:hypothetical protein